MIIGIDVQSTVIDWQAETLEITDKDDGSKHTIPLDATIHVTMLGYPEREEKQVQARDLGEYMAKGYIIEKIICEEDQLNEKPEMAYLVIERMRDKAPYGTPGESGDTSPMITSRRIERPIQIEERNDPPMPNSFDTTVVYPSTSLPEWFKGLQSIVEDETFTQLVIILGDGRVRYFITIKDGQ